jgi:hypothetical protein
MTNTAISQLPAERFAPRRQRTVRPAVKPSSLDRRSTKTDFVQYRTSLWAKVAPLIFSIAITGVLWIGWLKRDDIGLTPESGTGYWLGIVGSSFMVLLLLYPLRKRFKFLRLLGTVAFWFRTHMILGVLGPLLILLHANFRLGSINSNVALVAMLIVAGSGVVGRYLYGKIHLGLYGRKVAVQEILADADALKGLICAGLPVADRVVSQLNAFANRATATPESVLAWIFLLLTINWRARRVRARLISDARQVVAVEGKKLGWSRKVRRQQLASVANLVSLHVTAVRRAAIFALYERLFGLWHVLHLPLFFVLVIAAAIHIFAAHFF